MQNATRIKDRLWGVARKGADVSRERALSFLFRTKKVEVRELTSARYCRTNYWAFLQRTGGGTGVGWRVLGGGGYGSTVRSRFLLHLGRGLALAWAMGQLLFDAEFEVMNDAVSLLFAKLLAAAAAGRRSSEFRRVGCCSCSCKLQLQLHESMKA